MHSGHGGRAFLAARRRAAPAAENDNEGYEEAGRENRVHEAGDGHAEREQNCDGTKEEKEVHPTKEKIKEDGDQDG